jgi:hypothetical protein
VQKYFYNVQSFDSVKEDVMYLCFFNLTYNYLIQNILDKLEEYRQKPYRPDIWQGYLDETLEEEVVDQGVYNSCERTTTSERTGRTVRSVKRAQPETQQQRYEDKEIESFDTTSPYRATSLSREGTPNPYYNVSGPQKPIFLRRTTIKPKDLIKPRRAIGKSMLELNALFTFSYKGNPHPFLL